MFHYLDDDIVDLRLDDGSTWQYYWGARLERLPAQDKAGALRVKMIGHTGESKEGFIKAEASLRTDPILTFSMIDVQQGDGMIMETPGGKVLFIDAGEIKLFARHAAKRFPGTTAAKPLIVDAIIVTHGDADHFAGLKDIHDSETHPDPAKRLFIAPKRILHNGLVKRPLTWPDGKDRADNDMFGATTEQDGQLFATDLVDDPRSVPEADRNKHFKDWCEALDVWGARTKAVTGQDMMVRRIDHLASDAFDFLKEDGISVDLFGPIIEDVGGAPGLRFLKKPKDDVSIILGSKPLERGSLSASHTVNGHSINFRLRLGHVRFLFTGDMNQESMQRMREVLPDMALNCDILKTPHHGSADFDFTFLQQAGPVVSLVSSGDESAKHEHIHPRATLMAALGKASRSMPAIIFATELAAFFAYRGWVTDKVISGKQEPEFEGFERTNFGIIHVRTDGERVLALTHSGKRGMNEAYRFTVSATGEAKFSAKVVKVTAPEP